LLSLRKPAAYHDVPSIKGRTILMSFSTEPEDRYDLGLRDQNIAMVSTSHTTSRTDDGTTRWQTRTGILADGSFVVSHSSHRRQSSGSHSGPNSQNQPPRDEAPFFRGTSASFFRGGFNDASHHSYNYVGQTQVNTSVVNTYYHHFNGSTSRSNPSRPAPPVWYYAPSSRVTLLIWVAIILILAANIYILSFKSVPFGASRFCRV